MKRSSTLTLLALVFSIVGCTPAAMLSPTVIPSTPTAPQATAAPALTEKTGPWEIVLNMEVDHIFGVAAFLDETFGLTVGHGQDTIRYTTDGGQTWAEPTVNGKSSAGGAGHCRFGVDIVDAQVAWSCGGIAPATLSVDGGQTWTTRERPSARYCHRQCRFLSFLDDTTGWAASSFALAATDDGGETWTDVALPQGVGDDVPIMAIALRTASDGYLMDAAGVLYITQDGGQSWSTQPFGLDLGSRTVSSAAVRFPDADHGLVVVALVGEGQNEVLAMRTSDGGQTWEQEAVPSGPGTVYLARDGTLLTITSLMGEVTVLRCREY